MPNNIVHIGIGGYNEPYTVHNRSYHNKVGQQYRQPLPIQPEPYVLATGRKIVRATLVSNNEQQLPVVAQQPHNQWHRNNNNSSQYHAP